MVGEMVLHAQGVMSLLDGVTVGSSSLQMGNRGAMGSPGEGGMGLRLVTCEGGLYLGYPFMFGLVSEADTWYLHWLSFDPCLRQEQDWWAWGCC